MDEEKHNEIRSPEFFMADYYNLWYVSELGLELARKNGDLERIKNNRLRTFEEYVCEKEYYGYRCDLSIISKQFINQSNRLVKIYNHLISKEKIDINQLEKVVFLAKKICLKYN